MNLPPSVSLATRLLCGLLFSSSALLADTTWVGNDSPDWNTGSNWLSNSVPGYEGIYFGAAGTAGTTLNNNIPTPKEFPSVHFHSGAAAYTISGNEFILQGIIENNSSVTQTLNTGIVLSVNSGSMTGTGKTVLNGVISEQSAGKSVTVTSGTTVLGGANTFTGQVNVYNGATLTLTNTNALQDSHIALAGGSTLNLLSDNNAEFVTKSVGNDNMLAATGIFTINVDPLTAGSSKTITWDYLRNWDNPVTLKVTSANNYTLAIRNYVADNHPVSFDAASGNIVIGTLNNGGHNIVLDGTTHGNVIQSFYSGTPVSSGAITKNGTGTWVINGSIVTNGSPTLVNKGTLVLNAAYDNAAEINVKNGGTLTGTGSVSTWRDGVIIENGGTLTAGDSTALGTAGTFNLSIGNGGKLDFQNGSNYAVQIGGASPGDGLSFYDQVNVLGNMPITLTGDVALSLSLIGAYAPTDTDIYYILTRGDGGSFSTLFAGTTEGGTVDLGGGYTGQITYKADWHGPLGVNTIDGGNDVAIYNVTYSPIPEPASLGLIALAGLVAFVRRRNRQP